MKSPPTRGVRIETHSGRAPGHLPPDHPPRGGCGLKRNQDLGGEVPTESPPTRGVRIETDWTGRGNEAGRITPHAGGAD